MGTRTSALIRLLGLDPPYLSKLPQTSDSRQVVAGVFSVMRNVSVPWKVGDPEHPNLSPTYWPRWPTPPTRSTTSSRR